jgi:hypothetical protein
VAQGVRQIADPSPEFRVYGVLRRWDEKADPPYAVPSEGLQMLYGL